MKYFKISDIFNFHYHGKIVTEFISLKKLWSEKLWVTNSANENRKMWGSRSKLAESSVTWHRGHVERRRGGVGVGEASPPPRCESAAGVASQTAPFKMAAPLCWPMAPAPRRAKPRPSPLPLPLPSPALPPKRKLQYQSKQPRHYPTHLYTIN